MHELFQVRMDTWAVISLACGLPDPSSTALGKLRRAAISEFTASVHLRGTHLRAAIVASNVWRASQAVAVPYRTSTFKRLLAACRSSHRENCRLHRRSLRRPFRTAAIHSSSRLDVGAMPIFAMGFHALL